MAILQITTDTTGQVGVNPRHVKIVCNDSYNDIIAENYLRGAEGEGYFFYKTDLFDIAYGDANDTLGIFTATISDGSITLSPFLGEEAVVTPTVTNYIAKFANTDGQITSASGVAYNKGALASLSPTDAKGSLRITAANSSGDTITTITNASMGQASTFTLPDPGGAAANILVAPAALVSANLVKASGTAGKVADAGCRLITGITSTYAGGGTSNTFAVTGLTSSSHGSATIRTQANAAAIIKAVPGTDTLAITFSEDPGAGTTIDYVYTTASQT